jgi:hypothetical protein
MKDYSYLKGKPHWKRTTTVFMTLDEYSGDNPSYPELMAYVKAKTGKACSRKLISKWKASVNRAAVGTALADQLTANNDQLPVTSNLTPSNPSGIKNSKVKIKNDHYHLTPSKQSLILNLLLTPVTLKGISRFIGTLILSCSIIIGLSFADTPKRPERVTAQNQPSPSPTLPPRPERNNDEPRKIKIHLTLVSPEDLKVKEDQEIVAGQILSDRSTERTRLLNQRKQLELSRQKLDINIPSLQSPSPIPELRPLPPISYRAEEAEISLQQQELKNIEKRIKQQESKISELKTLNTDISNPSSPEVVDNEPKSTNLPPLFVAKSAFSEEETSINPENSPNPSLNSPNLDINPPNAPVSDNLTPSNPDINIIIEHETAILSEIKQERDKAIKEIEIAKAKLTAAKEHRKQAEHNHYLENNDVYVRVTRG